ncbi:uncharacterized protein LOC110450557 [Mizuhopecten yessoensis]|uniref:BZIP domain-containing protein n=1 Tax=Mizuhopecten yessoensis TaxID=6573 RepID=A0A210QNI9_MIZYE|nr:uncharacterized protein LOC110450557 [Mizuhopecten yessoensis]XP_021353821.1 uncharacterized protein LOC110450557 [Mizuhopecten yessoensis]XP_021353822.1 uncharacterized protein LOC110450557 [Mizuhopecten yessoensis]OWF50303.1 hypothetical protein KP79_PYT06281 [Mizuhopecten yessoensis]
MLCQDIAEEFDISVNSTDSNESLPDQNLERAYHISLQEGSSLPLLKEELRLKIQHRRLKSGQDELVVAQSPPKPDLLTLPEVLKKNRRRYQNRQSADRSRNRWKEYEKQLLETIALQEKRKADLERVRYRLMETKNMLTDVLNQHSKCSSSVGRDSKSQKFISLLDSEWHRKELQS